MSDESWFQRLRDFEAGRFQPSPVQAEILAYYRKLRDQHLAETATAGSVFTGPPLTPEELAGIDRALAELDFGDEQAPPAPPPAPRHLAPAQAPSPAIPPTDPSLAEAEERWQDPAARDLLERHYNFLDGGPVARAIKMPEVLRTDPPSVVSAAPAQTAPMSMDLLDDDEMALIERESSIQTAKREIYAPKQPYVLHPDVRAALHRFAALHAPDTRLKPEDAPDVRPEDKAKVASKLKRYGLTLNDLPPDFWTHPRELRSEMLRVILSSKSREKRTFDNRPAFLLKWDLPANYYSLPEDEQRKLYWKLKKRAQRPTKVKQPPMTPAERQARCRAKTGTKPTPPSKTRVTKLSLRLSMAQAELSRECPASLS